MAILGHVHWETVLAVNGLISEFHNCFIMSALCQPLLSLLNGTTMLYGNVISVSFWDKDTS